VAIFCCPWLSGQETPPLRLAGVVPGGIRTSVTESWGTFEFELTNLSDTDRHARVLVSYQGYPDVRYGRDVWAPANSILSSWLLVGPAADQPLKSARDIDVLLFDRTDGEDRLVLPRNDERLSWRKALYRPREPFTAIMLDEEDPEEAVLGRLPQPDRWSDEAVRLARTVRAANTFSQLVNTVHPGSLPAVAEAYDGVDQFIIASSRIARDPSGLQALRAWTEKGGRLWVMLDKVDPEMIAPLLGDALDFQVVDRTGLSSTRIEPNAAEHRAPEILEQLHERPVDFARVLLPPQERARHTVNGWPAWFVRQVGRGKIVFTTLGPRAWMRPRNRSEPQPPYADYPSLPIATGPLESVAGELLPPPVENRSRIESLRPLLVDEIGYSVVGLSQVVLIFGGFLLAALVAGVMLRKSHRLDLLGWLGPVAALGATAVFVILGESTRKVAPPMLAVAQIVDGHPGIAEASVHGMLAVYRPESGLIQAGVQERGLFDLDTAGIEGQIRTFMTTDLDSWRWDNLELPAGVRFAPFRTSVQTGEPITAIAHFGPQGLQGKLSTGYFRDLDDAILSTPGERNFAVRLRPDGAFSADGRDILPSEQFLAGAVLSDRQQRRQQIYREFLKRTKADRPDNRNLLLAWANPVDMHFTIGTDSRLAGSSLLRIPLQLERSQPGERVIIPGPFIPYRHMIDNLQVRPIVELNKSANMHLRFQLPEEVLPLTVQGARILAKINAPSRRVVIAARPNDDLVELHRVESPLDPIRVEINEERLLVLDKEGGIHLNLSLSDPLESGGANLPKVQGEEKWTIEYIEVEVLGTVKDGR
jgi:hypothetical protein